MFARLLLVFVLIGGGLSEYTGYLYSQSTPQFYQQNQVTVPIEKVRKEFYAFEAPDDEQDDLNEEQRFLSAIQKNVRVIFIKAPENKGLERAALGLAQQTFEDKTAIYVLNRQTDLGSLAQRLNTIRDQGTHKPEVHFVKYKTPEEAAHAQRYIQAQYDTLQGRSQVSNEGTASVIDFASKQPAPTQPVYSETPSYSVTPSYTGTTSYEPVPNYSGYSTQITQSSINQSSSSFSNNLNNNGVAGSSSIGVQPYSSNPVPRISARISAGRSFVFPTEPKMSNIYLPPLKRAR